VLCLKAFHAYRAAARSILSAEELAAANFSAPSLFSVGSSN
jgi:hypothetical protein